MVRPDSHNDVSRLDGVVFDNATDSAVQGEVQRYVAGHGTNYSTTAAVVTLNVTNARNGQNLTMTTNAGTGSAFLGARTKAINSIPNSENHPILSVIGSRPLARIVIIRQIPGIVVTHRRSARCSQSVRASVNAEVPCRYPVRCICLVDSTVAPAVIAVRLLPIERSDASVFMNLLQTVQ